MLEVVVAARSLMELHLYNLPQQFLLLFLLALVVVLHLALH
jgi:hypothetical protein